MELSATTHKRLSSIPLYSSEQALDTLTIDNTMPVLKELLLQGRYPEWAKAPKKAINSGTGGHARRLFAIIEAANVSVNIESKLAGFEMRYVNLLASANNPNEEDFFSVAPYLIEIDPEGKGIDWILKTLWGNNAVVFYQSTKDLTGMHYHFKKFTYLYDTEEKQYKYFRHFNPRILRDLLPILKPQDFAEYIEGIEKIYVESRQPYQVNVLPG
jgi:hypothetical protein